ncbi:hypothetical protein [Streptacidiphilus jiangxiensis]|uniref:DUF1963 domain-containing protein n=1 Tax=Streptacidiphilus jiangxiensis TaxID=235985 RepID=A0A1H7NDM7_STRJI|nr:hypothetical protein [Streptacidiphilus jiangxiensis]SEL21389.1 hypothetical protein SAMN05414137_106324 [Streptacidiphilus jiangxiensis]
MPVTTPVARAALLGRFPELTRYGRTATRLHPRPGAPTAQDSSVGGPLLWPSDEAWPTCTLRHPVEKQRPETEQEAARRHAQSVEARSRKWLHVAELEALGDRIAPELLARARASAATPPPPTGPGSVTWHEYEQLPEPVVLVPVLQLHRRETSAVPFPDGTDLLQILWCPGRHENHGPAARVFWRDAASVTDPLPVMPAPNHVERETFVPRPCVVHPEDVVEYPPICLLPREDEGYEHFGMMPAELEDAVRRWSDGQPERDDYDNLSRAPGWKVGGWDPSSAGTENLRTCECGARMRPLLSTDYSEWLDLWPPQGDPGFHWGDPMRWQDREPTGVNFTRSGEYLVLSCPAEPQQHPLSYVITH